MSNLNKHGLHRVPIIGITCWLGDKLPNYFKDIMNINAGVFDTIYLVANSPDAKYLPNNVIIINYSSCNYLLKDDNLTPSQFSDYLCYDGINFLSQNNISVEKLIYFDADFIIYNKLLITRLFDNYSKSFLSLEDSAYPGDEVGAKFYNSAFSFMIRDDYLSPKLVDAMCDSIQKNPDKYTASGPSMLGKFNRDLLDFPQNLRITTCRGESYMYMKDVFEIGIHLEASVLFYTWNCTDLSVDIEDSAIFLDDEGYTND